MSEDIDMLAELLPVAKKASYESVKGEGRMGKFVVVAGESDTGKTYFCASAPDPIVIIDMDDGTEAIGKQYDEELQEEYDGIFPNKDIRVIHVDMDSSLDPKDNRVRNKDSEFSTSLVNALVKLKTAIVSVENALDKGAPIKTIVFETASWLWMASQDWMKYRVLDLDEDTRNYVNQAFDWAIAQKEYRRIFMRLKKLRKYGCHVIITAHTKPEYNSKMEIVGEVIHWWHQSIKMSDTVLWIRSKPKKVGKKVVNERVCEFHRLRGVDNAKKLAKPIENVTWDKFVAEMSRIRLVSKDKKQDAEESSTKYTVEEESEEKPKRKRRAKINED